MYANYNNKTAFNLNTNVNWFDNKKEAWFIDYSQKTKVYKQVEFTSGKINNLFDHKAIATFLNKKEKDSIKAVNLSLQEIKNLIY